LRCEVHAQNQLVLYRCKILVNPIEGGT
jgi:hypothetical protein